MTRWQRRMVIAAGATLVAGISLRKFVIPADAPEPDLPPPNITRIDPPQALPAVTFKTLEGATVTLAEYRGRPVVLNFWATWCGPCVKEMPELDRLAAAQGPGGIAVLAVSADRTGEAAIGPFLAAHQVTHATILLDQGSDAVHALNTAGFPTTLIIDREGRLRGRLEGPAAWADATAAITALTT